MIDESLARSDVDLRLVGKGNCYIRGYYEGIMEKVAELSKTALFEKKLNLIIFPEGTRSVKLAEGRTGLAQLALHTEKRIVPVACNNSEEVYTGSLPILLGSAGLSTGSASPSSSFPAKRSSATRSSSRG